MTKHTDDALAPYDDAGMQSDESLDPVDPPAWRFFIKRTGVWHLTKGYVGVKWRKGKMRKQTIRELSADPSKFCCSPLTYRQEKENKLKI